MHQKLIGFLERNKPRLIREWRAHFTGNALGLGLYRSQIPAVEIIQDLYGEILARIRDFPERNGDQNARLSFRDPRGFRLKFPWLLELLLSGEEVIRDAILLDENRDAEFGLDDTESCFERFHEAMRAMMKHYAEIFCGDCEEELDGENRKLLEACACSHEAGHKDETKGGCACHKEKSHETMSRIH